MQTYIARQAIHDKHNEVVGYELLFRQGFNEDSIVSDDYQATLKLVRDVLLNFSIRDITGGKRIFIKFNQALIEDELPELFHPDQLIIELSPGDFSTNALERLREYKKQGYLIALEHMLKWNPGSSVLPLADMVKVDFSSMDTKIAKRLMDRLHEMKKIVIADKVASPEMFEDTLSYGSYYFQGDYFQRPKILESTAAAVLPMVYMECLCEIEKEVIDYGKLETIIKKDASMTLSILKLMSTVVYHPASKITSVKQALVRLGAKESRRVIMFNMIKAIATEDSSTELLHMSLKRAKLAESLAPLMNLKARSDELFMVGLLSLVNVLMKRQMSSILSNVPLNKDVIDALMGHENELSGVIELIILHEMASTEALSVALAKKQIDDDLFNHFYLESIYWADQILKGYS